ncbi:hypothetical protein [Streptomyces fodineus]|uniref:hypothetical protein n=1 Tax=Streptomyces fodineus TaxID=1904616 RepID=UPI00131CB232|nr:hypothetical protein [Streptomyces fodineus]
MAGYPADMTGLVPAELAHLPIVVFLGAATVAGPPAIRRRVATPWLPAAFLAGTAVVAMARVWPLRAALAVCPLAGAAIGATFSALFVAVGASEPAGRASEIQRRATSVVPADFAIDTSSGASTASAPGPLARRADDRDSCWLHPHRRATNRARSPRHTCESGPVDMKGQR